MSSILHQPSAVHPDLWTDTERTSSPIALRIRVAWHRTRLDQMLADGVAPDETPELGLRARQVVRVGNRIALANSLEDIVQSVRSGRTRRSGASPPLATRDIRACTAALLGLALSLRSKGEVPVRGVALTQRLLADGAGPLYVYGRDDELWHVVREASTALDGFVPDWPR